MSPDCNPIENIWGLMAKEVYSTGRQYDSTDELIKAIKKSWQKITLSHSKKLIDGMHRRCIELIAQKGSKINY